MLSTLLLTLSGYGRLTGVAVIACLLVTVGALIAAKDMWLRRKAVAAGS